MKPFENSAVAQVFETYPPEIRRKLLALRKIIFEVAKTTEGVGVLEEALKWSEPAYITSQSKSGSTIRLGWKKSNPARYAIYFNCQTNLVESFRALFRRELNFVGNRAIVFDVGDVIARDALCVCLAAALTYHRDKSFAKSINL